MNLYEFQGKKLYKEVGIPIPEGKLIWNEEDALTLDNPCALKAQVLTGGRGKAGGIKLWDGKTDIKTLISQIMSLKINGESVKLLLAEESVKIIDEYYVAITYKGSEAQPILIISPEGGVEIEVVAEKTPDKICTIPINSVTGIRDYQLKYAAEFLGYNNEKELNDLVRKLYQVYKTYDATLVEINPLAVTEKGLMALDAKVVLDDHASFRKQALHDLFRNEAAKITGIRETGHKDTITYVELEGNVGLISDGAGTGMLTLDLIKDAGGEAANFCELGGITNAQVMYDAMKKVLANPKVKSLLIVLIGGFNRMDEMADGIILYKERHGLNVPLYIRMCGTLEEVGKAKMSEINIPTYDKLPEAVLKAVKSSKEVHG